MLEISPLKRVPNKISWKGFSFMLYYRKKLCFQNGSTLRERHAILETTLVCSLLFRYSEIKWQVNCTSPLESIGFNAAIRLFLSWCFLFIHVEPYIKQHLQKIVETNYSFIIIRQSLSGKRSTWCTDKSSRLLHRASSSCTMLMFTRQWLIWLTVVATFFDLPFYIEVQS